MLCGLTDGAGTLQILEQPRLVNLRNRSLLPVVRERTSLADALCRYLGQLGVAAAGEGRAEA